MAQKRNSIELEYIFVHTDVYMHAGAQTHSLYSLSMR